MPPIERIPTREVDLRKESAVWELVKQISSFGLEYVTNHLILRKKSKQLRLPSGELVLDEQYYGKTVDIREGGGKIRQYYIRTCDTNFNMVDSNLLSLLRKDGRCGIFSIGPGVCGDKEYGNVLFVQIFSAQTDTVAKEVQEIVVNNFQYVDFTQDKRLGETHFLICAHSLIFKEP